MKKIICLFAILTLVFSSCVSTKKYQALENEKSRCSKQLSEARISNRELKSMNEELKAELDKQKKELQNTQLLSQNYKEQAEENDMAYKDMKQQLDQLNERLQETLSNKSQNLKQLNEELIKTRASLDKRAEELDNQENELKMLKIEFAQKEEMLAQLQARLEEKEKEVEEIHRKISDALLGFADKGLSIERKNGKVYVSMEEKLLFDSGSWTVSKEGEDALREIATVLANNPEIDVMVEGHTDNVPMNGKIQVKDNWDLSVMRASAITKILLKNGKISPKRIIPSGRGEYCPIVDNSTKESRAKNRRTEIILTPKFEELIDIIK